MMTSIGIFVHDLGSREVRVKFDRPVPDAEDAISYSFTSTSHIPSVIDVSYYDADMMSVKITFDAALTNGGVYFCQISNLFSELGVPVTDVPFEFLATDMDLPRILGAYQSKRGNIDIVCDRPVAQTSVSSVAHLVSTGGSFEMTLVPWTSSQSKNSVRFSYASAFAGTEYDVLFSGIMDASGNTCMAGSIPLTLAYEPSGYSDLVQARATLAVVADVSNAEGFSTAVLRVFFSCPMLASDVLDTAKWKISQSGAHVSGDMANKITASNATDNSSFILLVNDAKNMMNAHMVSHAHLLTDFVGQITTADAVDYATAQALTDEIRNAYASHYERTDMHLYADHIHAVDLSITDPMDQINSIKVKFNNHIPKVYSLEFSNSYHPIGPITNFSSASNASMVFDQFTWFVDLHAFTDAIQASFSISFKDLQSEDLASIITGTVEAEPMAKLPSVVSLTRSFRGVTIRTDCDSSIFDTDSIFLLDTDTNMPLRFSASVSSSVPVLLWAFNNVLHAYKIHISNPLLSPWLGAKHKNIDTVNIVSAGDYATETNLNLLIGKVNALKSKMNAHMTSESYHYGKDVPVETPDASDTESLVSLILGIRDRLALHNSSGFVSNSNNIPHVYAYHGHPGAGIISANVTNLIKINFDDGVIDGNLVSLSVPILKTWKDNRPNIADRTVFGSILESFQAVDNFPVLTSAVSRPGISLENPGPYLLTDTVELYLSKPMRNQSISVGTNVMVSGAPVSLTGAEWIADRVISVQVTNMSTTSYSVEASGLYDVAGNPIFQVMEA